MLHIGLPCAVLAVLAMAAGAPEKLQHERDAPAALDAPHEGLHKRSPGYDFGLGKRAYSYVSEYKRLPVYNFGLGKRSSADTDASDASDASAVDTDASADAAADWQLAPRERQLLEELLDRYDLDDSVLQEKRGRPYSFGLGKRSAGGAGEESKRARLYEFGLGKRTPYYNFGLGKRLPGRSYSFGLGKRLSPGKFNFGLGKRERNANRFNFGLGKRSADVDVDLDAGDVTSERTESDNLV